MLQIMWSISVNNMKNSFYIHFSKPFLDILLSGIALLILSPLFIFSMLCIKLEDGGRIFFIQERVGRHFKPFKLIKFRTMAEIQPENAILITKGGDNRITNTGRILRMLKIDELPQLINVLFRQMSIVGPRPEVDKYVSMFKEDYSFILKTHPGISDYASIKYRDEESILAKYSDTEDAYINIILPDKINLYKKYVSNISLKTDMEVILKTVWSLFNVK